MYNIEDLETIFLTHAEKADQNHQEWIDCFKQTNPGEEIPEHLLDDFNLPRAIACICREIMLMRSVK